VPAIAAAFEQTLCCARCRYPLSVVNQTEIPTDGVGEQIDRPPDAGLDDVEGLSPEQQAELDAILARAEWLLGLEGAPADHWKGARTRGGFHAPHPRLQGHHLSLRNRTSMPHRASRITIASWCALAVALTGFVCGGILLAWSLLSNRPELWNVGETVTLASQVGLLVGLILQLERLGHDRHQTVNRLTILDERVESLRNSTALWSTNRNLRADGPNRAPTDSLLADLKSQIDQLANQLGEKRSA
jgi:hypothetical protein